jgi:hypothetical protein
MGLLDKFSLGDWPGLLNTPTSPPPPPQSPAPLFVPPTEAAYGEPTPGDLWNTNPSQLGQAMDGMVRNLAAKLAATRARASAPEPADHGLSERQKLTPLQKASSPITSYPETYLRMNQDARDQISYGFNQLSRPDTDQAAPPASGSEFDAVAPHPLSNVAKGAGNIALGGLGYFGSPFSAAYRSLNSQPFEDVTGIPREWTEFAAQLATPGLGLLAPFGKRAVVPPRMGPRAPFGVTLPEREVTQALPPKLPGQVGPLSEIAPARTGRTEMTPDGRAAPVFEGAMPELADRYPQAGQSIWKTDRKTGKRYPAKQLTDEERRVQALLDPIQKDIDAGNYTPWFDPAGRFRSNPANHPPMIDTRNIRAVKASTQTKYDAMARDPQATQRILDAFQRGQQQEKNARDYAYMGQLENGFINELGPDEGPTRFKGWFADPVGATTAGAKPRANLRMALFANYLRMKGLSMPTAAYDVPHPAGGAYVIPNLESYQKMQSTGLTPATPKGYNFSHDDAG